VKWGPWPAQPSGRDNPWLRHGSQRAGRAAATEAERDSQRAAHAAAEAARRAAAPAEQHDSQRDADAAAHAARRAAMTPEERDSQRDANAAAHAARRAAEAPAQRAARRAGDAAAHHDARHGQGPYTLAAPADMPTDEYLDTFERNAIANEANVWARSGLWRFEAFRDWDFAAIAPDSAAVARGSVGAQRPNAPLRAPAVARKAPSAESAAGARPPVPGAGELRGRAATRAGRWRAARGRGLRSGRGLGRLERARRQSRHASVGDNPQRLAESHS
jgi:hypothetical protein